MSGAGAAVRIRRMAEADLDCVMEIAEGLKEAPRWTRAAYQAAMDVGGTLRRVALVAKTGDLAGFAVASVVAPEAELETIAVAREWQRKGVAQRLFAALIEELSAAGVKDVLLEVRGSNEAAIGLYRVLGFQESGRRRGYYADPVEDAVLFRLRLE
jgi:[ribosomal protein S18]-alanine N-acetyltransferase